VSGKWNFLKTLFKPGEFENVGSAFLVWTEKILKTELFESDAVITILM